MAVKRLLNINNQSPAEEEINFWKQVKDGDKVAFIEIYNRYFDDLYRYGWQLIRNQALVEDAIHDIYVSIWDKREKLPDVHHIKLYLLSALRRVLIRKVKKEKVFNNRLLNEFSWDDAMEPSFLDNAISRINEEETNGKINQALSQLTERQKEIIYLKFYQNLSYQEIASMLNLDQKYAYNLMARALASMRDKYESLGVKFLPFVLYYLFHQS